MENWQRQLASAKTDDDKGQLLFSLAGELLSLRQWEAATDAFLAIGAEDRFSQSIRAQAFTRAGEMTVMTKKLNDGVKYHQTAAAILEGKADRTRQETNQLVESLAKLANSIHYIDRDADDLALINHRLLELEDEYSVVNGSTCLSVGLDAARYYQRRDDREEAILYSQLANRNLDKAPISLSLRIASLIEVSNGLYDRWNDPALIERLSEVWDDDRFKGDAQIMRVGNQILWARFLARRDNPETFEAFAAAMADRGDSLLSELRGKSEDAEQVMIYETQALASLAFVKEKNRQPTSSLLDKLQNRSLAICRLPLGASREEQRECRDAFGHIAGQVRERQRPEQSALEDGRNEN